MTYPKWKLVGSWLGLLVSAGSVIWLVYRYDWGGVDDALRSARWIFFSPVPFVMIAIFGLRAIRWQALFQDEHRPRLSGAFLSLSVGYLFNNLLPARAGELVRIHVIGRREKLPRSTALGTVVVERTLDLFVLLGLLTFVLLTQPLPDWTYHAGRVVAMLAFSALVVFLVLGWLGDRVIDTLTTRMNFLPGFILFRLKTSGRAFVGSVAEVLRVSHLARFAVLSCGIWVLELTVLWFIAKAFDLPLAPLGLLFVMLIIALGTMVPASPGYVGTFEIFGLNALSMIGIAGAGALGFVIALHATLLLGSSLIGAVSLAIMGWPRLATTSSVGFSNSNGNQGQ